MSAKNKKLQKGPSWFEVGLGAFLSILLGLALGAAYLVSKPVAKVAAIPKDAPAGAVYYLEGETEFNKSADVAALRKSFVDGESVSVTEGELNALIGDLFPSATPAAPDASKPADKPPADQKLITPGLLNARIRDGKVQFANPIGYNILGITGTIVVQASGTFSRHGSTFAFDPEVFYVGGCPMQRLLFLRGWVQGKLLFAQQVPDDLAAAWSKLADVSVDGSTLRLKGPQG
jgi:hypothetical protein